MLTELKNTKLIAFDLDGTLVDSIDDLAYAANATRAYLNLAPLDIEEVKSYVGDGIGSLVHRAISAEKNGEVEPSVWTQGFEFFVNYYALHLTDHTKPYPEVEDTLKLLKRLGYPLAVITNKNEMFANQILKNLNLMENFSIVIGGDTLTEKKPSSLPLLHVAEIFNITKEQLVMVGDSYNDLRASFNAGSNFLGVTYGYEPNLEQIALQDKLPFVAMLPAFIDIYHQFAEN